MSRSSYRMAWLALATSHLAATSSVEAAPASLHTRGPAPKAPTSYASEQSLTAPAGQWPADDWWQGYGDTQLAALIREGLNGATDLRVAQARYAAAAATAGETRATLLPSLTASGSVGFAKQSYNYLFPSAFAPKGWRQTGEGSLNLDWQIDFWGKNRASLAATRADQRAAGAEAAQARLTVSTGIASAYADLADLYAQHDAALQALKVRNQTLALMIKRQSEGLENEGAVARERSRRATSQGELASLDEQLTLVRHRIAALMGAGPDRGQTIIRPAVSALTSAGLPANIPAQLIGRRPDVAAARATADAAADRIRVARAAFYPNVNLSGLIGLQALGLANVFKSGSDYGSVGPAISLPIFDGGKLTARKRSAEARYAEAVAQYDATLVKALQDIADAVTSRNQLNLRLADAQAAQDAARTAWEVSNNRYRGGLANALDVLDAEDTLITARRTAATLQTRAFNLDVTLVRALGGGFHA